MSYPASSNWSVSGPITLTNPGTHSSTEGGTVSVSLSASYSGSGSLSYSAIGLPAGLKINTSTGAITGTAALGDAASSPYSVTVQASASSYTADQTSLTTVTASDGAYSASVSYTWIVNNPINITEPSDQTNYQAYTVSVSISATDASSGTLCYSAKGLPLGLSISTSTGTIAGEIAPNAPVGTYQVIITASDNTYMDCR